jgi:hypothetical protein
VDEFPCEGGGPASEPSAVEDFRMVYIQSGNGRAHFMSLTNLPFVSGLGIVFGMARTWARISERVDVSDR